MTLAILLFAASCVSAQTGITLNEISSASLPGDLVEVRLDLSGPVGDPRSFAIDNPARIAIDLPGVGLNLRSRSQQIGVGVARSVAAAEAGGRTRVVLNLVRLVPYDLRADGSSVFITLNPSGVSTTTRQTTAPSPTVAYDSTQPSIQSSGARGVNSIDFRRGENGEGRVEVLLSDPSIVVDTREQGDKIVVDILNAALPGELQRRLDVLDFGTPVSTVDTFARRNDVRMEISAKRPYDLISYQSDNRLTIEVKRLTPQEEEDLKKKQFNFTGERLSLNFQNIEVRAVLQLIADFTGLNIIASDTVAGSLTLRLKNVPWDQALDIILKSKDLAMRRSGNVVRVAPREEIVTQERLELEQNQQTAELAPLRTEFVRLNYANASDIGGLLSSGGGGEGGSLLSERGSVKFDERTNTLIVRDTDENLVAVRNLVLELDRPVRQVLIESRIVVADDSFTRDLGVQFGFSRSDSIGSGEDGYFYSIGGGLAGDTTFNTATVTTSATGVPTVTQTPTPTSFNEGNVENFIVDLPITGPSGILKFAIGKLGSDLLQLELQAMQVEGRGEVLSNPRVITSNQQEAVIEQGTEIPFQEASSSGATSTSFKKAVLSLRVTPLITPDDRVIMDLEVNQDSVGQVIGGGIPSIDTREVRTRVLVENGETVVLGGIYQQTTRNDTDKVPFLGDLPGVGFLFRRESKINNKDELLIFVTPKILDDRLSVQ